MKPIPMTLVLAMVLGCLVGCGKSGPPRVQPAVMVTVTYPGASPEVVDGTVCGRIEQMIMYIDDVSSITCVSGFESGKIYVQGGPNSDVASLIRNVENRIQLAAPMLPEATKVGHAVDVSGQQIPPPPDIHNVPVRHVDIDRTKKNALGVAMDDINRALREAKSGESLENVTVRSVNGSTVRLGDFAKVKTVYEPNYRVRRWPEAVDEKTPVKKRG